MPVGMVERSQAAPAHIASKLQLQSIGAAMNSRGLNLTRPILRRRLLAALLVVLCTAAALAACSSNNDDPESAAAVGRTSTDAQTGTPDDAPDPNPNPPARAVRTLAAVGATTPIPSPPAKPATLRRALAKAFFTYEDVATLNLSSDLILAWGIGATLGGSQPAISVWSDSSSGPEMIASADLPSGGMLRPRHALRPLDGGTAQRAWFEAYGRAGPHGVSYDLLLWNGAHLIPVYGHASAALSNVVTPGAAAALRDFNGDGAPEILIDRTDPYHLPYGANVWLADAAILRHDGESFQEVAPALPSAADVPRDAFDKARSSLAFARAGWWANALQHAEAALACAEDNEQLLWNLIVIRERAGAAQREAERSDVPWLGLLLAGDWQRSVEALRAVPHDRWLNLESLLADTPLAGSEPAVAALVRQRADAAVAVADHISAFRTAPAFLLQGLARWWLDQDTLPAADSLVMAIEAYAHETLVFDLLFWIGYRGG